MFPNFNMFRNPFFGQQMQGFFNPSMFPGPGMPISHPGFSLIQPPFHNAAYNQHSQFLGASPQSAQHQPFPSVPYVMPGLPEAGPSSVQQTTDATSANKSDGASVSRAEYNAVFTQMQELSQRYSHAMKYQPMMPPTNGEQTSPEQDPSGRYYVLPRSRADFPDVPHWTLNDWNDEMKAKRAKGTAPGKEKGKKGPGRLKQNNENVCLLWLHNANGTLVDGATAQFTRGCFRQVFVYMAKQGRAPETWVRAGDLTVAAECYFYVKSMVPQLQLDDGTDWKCRLIAIVIFSQWRRQYLAWVARREARERGEAGANMTAYQIAQNEADDAGAEEVGTFFQQVNSQPISKPTTGAPQSGTLAQVEMATMDGSDPIFAPQEEVPSSPPSDQFGSELPPSSPLPLSSPFLPSANLPQAAEASSSEQLVQATATEDEMLVALWGKPGSSMWPPVDPSSSVTHIETATAPSLDADSSSGSSPSPATNTDTALSTTAPASKGAKGAKGRSKVKDVPQWPAPVSNKKPMAMAGRRWKAENPNGTKDEFDTWYRNQKQGPRQTRLVCALFPWIALILVLADVAHLSFASGYSDSSWDSMHSYTNNLTPLGMTHLDAKTILARADGLRAHERTWARGRTSCTRTDLAQERVSALAGRRAEAAVRGGGGAWLGDEGDAGNAGNAGERRGS
ncbi:hypothetical protein C8T65DRAFT_696068 [Cerioporus squamosus]|nr:hypothetical protein C8T65DRAFT_696068 [Cerioporus squamosus]